MTEVPEHLLRRSAERRAALKGEAPPAAEPTGGDDAGGGAVEAAPSAAAPAAPASAGTPARAAAPAYTGPPQPPPRKQRVPVWAMPVVVALPLWAFLYAGAFGERAVEKPGIFEEGRAVYAGSCAGCHGATGGGVSGPALDEVLTTFPDFAAHVAWVNVGSKPVAGREYRPGVVATGNMPGFEAELSPAQILAVVCYERMEFGDLDEPPAECVEEEGDGPSADESAAEGEASG